LIVFIFRYLHLESGIVKFGKTTEARSHGEELVISAIFVTDY
ncbi:MAG: hypothetical protein QG588_320, partial [Candidatus Poribacteria bacterium]|nr:hypothetical protein [Candidatus Poribacteria bacterium]